MYMMQLQLRHEQKLAKGKTNEISPEYLDPRANNLGRTLGSVRNGT